MELKNLGNPVEVNGGDVDFTVDENNQSIFCRISREALDDHFDAASHGSSVKAYVAHSATIQAKAVAVAKANQGAGAARHVPLVLQTHMF